MGSSSILRVLVLLFLMAGAFTKGHGQTFGEFFNQKKTQKRYLLEQIAALQLYTGYLKKGYEIANGGLTTIKDFSSGEFSLHHAFISGLKKVSPVVRNHTRVAEIIAMQVAIGHAFSGMKSDLGLSIAHRNYISEVRENLWEACLKDLEELLLVVSAGKLEMGDEERLRRLDGIYLSMQEKAAFVQHFSLEVGMLLRQRELEIQTIEKLRRSYGIQE